MAALQELLQKADFYKEKRVIPSAEETANSLVIPLSDWPDTGETAAACDFMLELASKPEPEITEDNIIKLHTILYSKTDSKGAGRYRTTEVSEAGYTAPKAEEVPRLTGHLIDQITSSKSTLHPIELAAMVHKRLLDISPFDSGNEPVAVLVMNVILVHEGYGVVTIPTRRRKDYLNALSASRRLYDMEPFSKIIAECVIGVE